MNDHERSNRQMNQTLEYLRGAIQKLNIPVSQRDAMLGLVRDPASRPAQRSATRRDSAIRSRWNRRSGSLSLTAC